MKEQTLGQNIIKETVVTALDARISAAAARHDLDAQTLLEEYKKIKGMNYLQYVNYLLHKYGKVTNDYFRTEECNSKTPGRGNEGLHRHHVDEDKIPDLENPKVAKANSFEHQKADRLVYCNPIEHIILHILIAEETVIAEVGRMGAQKLLDEHKSIPDPLRNTLAERLQKTGTLLKHNIELYNELKYKLIRDGKVLVTLATGGGKTTTALQYIVENNLRALVLGPKNSIVGDWENRMAHYPQIKQVMCYASFMKYTEAEVLELMKNFDIIVLDEAHHLAKNNAWAKNVGCVITNKLVAVLAITAEEKRSDNTKVADIWFDGEICKGMTTVEFLKTGLFWPISYVSTLLKNPHLKLDPECAFLQRDLDLALNTMPAVEIIKKYRPDYTKCKGIVFVPRGDGTGDNFKEARDILIQAYGIEVPIWEINYKLGAKACRDALRNFNNAEYGFIISIDMISEGVHPKGINMEIILRNSQSPLVVNQQIGRLTRIKKEYEDNPNCILFDLVNVVKTVDYRDLEVTRGGVKGAIKETAKKSDAVIYDDQIDALCEVLKKSETFTPCNLFEEVCEF